MGRGLWALGIRMAACVAADPLSSVVWPYWLTKLRGVVGSSPIAWFDEITKGGPGRGGSRAPPHVKMMMSG